MKKIFVVICILFKSFDIACQTNVFLCDMAMSKDSLLYYNDTIFTGNYHCYDNGKLKGIGYVTGGKMDSLSYFDSKGNLVQQVFYKDGKEDFVRQYVNGLISKFVITSKDNKLDGLWEELTFDGNLLKRRYYKADKPVGLWVTFDRQGNLMNETFFDEMPVVYKEYVYKKFFKRKGNVLVNIKYYNNNQKLIKKESNTISDDEYLLLSQERKKIQ